MKYAIFAFALVLFLAMPLVSAYPYEMNFYSYSDSASPFDVNIPGFETTLSCTNQLSAKASMTGSSFSVTSSFFSPDNTNIGTGTLTNQDSFTCKNIGETQTTSANGDIFESEMSIVHTATSGNVTSTAFYNCSSLSTDLWLNISINSTTDLTSYGHVVNRYSDSLTSLQSNASVAAKINISNFNDCTSIDIDATGYLQVGVSTSSASTFDRQVQLFYPFNSSSGIFHYNISSGVPYIICGSSCVNVFTGSVNLFLVGMEDNSIQTLASETIATCVGGDSILTNYEDTLILEKDTLFALVMIINYDEASGCGGDARTATLAEPEFVDYEIYIYEADLVCGDWSVCDGTTQTRTCIDSRGIAPPEIQFRTCAIGIIENATLGFESFISTSDILKCEPQGIFNCGYAVINTTLDRPQNWTIIDPSYGGANFLQMTQEYATEGTRSLKMWQIPPKDGEVITNTTCGNLTSSIVPQLTQGISNDTFSVTHNITFPATNMQIGFDVKKCQNQVLQHSNIGGLLWSNVSGDPFYLIPPTCFERCYSNGCSSEPNGRYAFNVLDTITGQSIFGVVQFKDAELQTLSPTYDISNLGIIPGRTYNIVFALSNENPNDASGNCVYLDSVRYEVTEQSLLEFVPDCISRCLDSTRIEATRTESGSCFIVTQEDSPLCTDDETAEAIENQEDFCRDLDTLRTFNEKTGKYESIDCSESGNVCSNGRCQTEEEAALEDSTTPAEDSTEFLAWFNWLFSPLFIYLIITFVLAGIIGKSLTSGNKDGKGTFETFGVVIIIMMIIGTLPGIAIIPIWIAIAIIVIVALLIAQIMGIFAGRG